MNERMKLNPAEAAAAGEADARSIMAEMLTAEESDNHGELMSDAFAEIIGLAVENRIEECTARLEAFCGIIGALLYRSVKIVQQSEKVIEASNTAFLRISTALHCTKDEERVIDAVIATCSQVSAGRIIAAHPNDDDATVTLAELQLAVQDLEPNFTESEGGEL